MDIQSTTAYSPTPGPSITDLAQQHGVSRESLLAFVRSKIQQAQQADGEPGLDDATLERMISQTIDRGHGHPDADPAPSEAQDPAAAGYGSNARSAPTRPTGTSSISVLA